MSGPYAPSCPACRSNSTSLFYIHCGGCQVRRQLHLHAQRADPTRPITKAEADAMDSTMQPLEGKK